MTVVVATDEGGAARIKAHLLKLVHVVRVDELTDRPSIVRELALVKIAAGHDNRAAVMQLAQVFDARVVDVAPASLVVEICASESKVDGLLDVLRPYGVIEAVRTGRVAMARGSLSAPGAARVEAVVDEGIAYSV
jgi:acetolactate synthase-1/3 small subunit